MHSPSNYPAGVSQKDIDKLCPGNGDHSDVERMAMNYREVWVLCSKLNSVIAEDFTDSEAEKICRRLEDALEAYMAKVRVTFPSAGWPR